MIRIDHTLSNFRIHRSFESIVDLSFSNLLLSRVLGYRVVVLHTDLFTYFTSNAGFLSTRAYTHLLYSKTYKAPELMVYLNMMGFRGQPLVLDTTVETYVKYD